MMSSVIATVDLSRQQQIEGSYICFLIPHHQVVTGAQRMSFQGHWGFCGVTPEGQCGSGSPVVGLFGHVQGHL